MNRSRKTADLASHGNIFVDIANDRVGIGTTQPTHKIDVSGNIKLHDQTGHNNHITYKSSGPAPHLHFPTGPLSNLARTPYIGFGDRGDSSGDFKIYHDHYNAHLKLNANFGGGYGAGLGGLFLSNHSTSGVIGIQGANGSGASQNSIFIPAGATAGVKIYQAGQLRFETVGYGVTVHGTTETQELNVTGVTTMSGSLTVTSAAPEIFLTDTNANSDYSIVVNGGQFRVRDETNSANRLAVNSDGHVDIYGRLDAVGGFVASSNSSIEGNLELTSTYPSLTFTDTNHNSDYRITNNDGQLIIYDITNSAHRLNVNADGHIDILGHLDVGAGIDVTGNITATGTLDTGNATINRVDVTVVTDGSRNNGVFIEPGDTGQGNRPKLRLKGAGNAGLGADAIQVFHDNGSTKVFEVDYQGNIEARDLDSRHADFSAGIDVTGMITATGEIRSQDDIRIQSTYPRLYLTDTDSNDDFSLINNNGSFLIYNDTQSAFRLKIDGTTGQCAMNLRPTTDGGFDLGTNTLRWANVYADTLYIGNAISNGVVLAGITTCNSDILVPTSMDSTNAGGVAIQRFWSFNLANGNVYKCGHWHEGEGAVQLLISVRSITGAHSGTTTYIFQGGFRALEGSGNYDGDFHRRLMPLASGAGHGNGADRGQDSFGGWEVFINQQTSYTYGVVLHVPSGLTNKSLQVTVTELNRGNTFTDQSSSAAYSSITTSGTPIIPSGYNYLGHTHLRDNVKINLGTSNDLQIYHSPNSSYIDNNTNHLYIRSNVDGDDNGNIYLQALSGENSIICNDDGSVQLYHDNSLRFETTSIGAQLDTILTLYGAAGNPGRLRLQEGGALSEIMVARNSDSSSFLYFKTEIAGTTATRVVIDESGHFRPFTDSTYDLGITGTRWRNVYADTLYGDGSNITDVTATRVTATDQSSDTTCFPLFVQATTGDLTPHTGTNLAFNSATGALTATSFSGDGSNLTGITQTTINSNADNRVITGSGTANTLNAESKLTFYGTNLRIDQGNSSDGIVGQAYSGYFGLRHADQTYGSEYMILSNDAHTYISATSGSHVYIRSGNNDSTNQLIVATGANGLTWRGSAVWHAGNDGSGSGLDADTVDGLHLGGTGNNGANQIVRTQANGYIFSSFINTTSGDTGTGSDCTRFYASQDAYLRYIDLGSMRSVMNVSAVSGVFSGREDQTSDSNYWVGSMGWGSNNFDTTVWDYGSCFFDVWSNPSGQPSGTSHWQGFQAMHYTNQSARYGFRITCGAGNPAYAYIQGRWNTTTNGWHKLWNAGNDGSGSGLDADTLDGQEGSYYKDVPSGTVMVFRQNSAPTGWTKSTSHNNKAMRIVSGNVGSGGSNGFTTALNSSRGTSGGSVSNHTLTTAQMPSHTHTGRARNHDVNNSGSQGYPAGDAHNAHRTTDRPHNRNMATGTHTNTGSTNSHNHGFSNPSINLNVQYLDFIICTRS